MISLLEMTLRLALALALGGAIGLERELHEHRAGMRTNALVALGSALFTLVSAYGFLSLLSFPHTQVDPTRIASYIVAGIGFLGAGTIGTHKTGAHGLTTAAAIWTVAAIGVACGIGLYWVAVIVAALTLLVLSLLHFIEQHFLPNQANIVFHLRLAPEHPVGELLAQIYSVCLAQKLRVETLSSHYHEDASQVDIQCRHTSATAALHALDQLLSIPGVQHGSLDLQDLDDFKPTPRGD